MSAPLSQKNSRGCLSHILEVHASLFILFYWQRGRLRRRVAEGARNKTNMDQSIRSDGSEDCEHDA